MKYIRVHLPNSFKLYKHTYDTIQIYNHNDCWPFIFCCKKCDYYCLHATISLMFIYLTSFILCILPLDYSIFPEYAACSLMPYKLIRLKLCILF